MEATNSNKILLCLMRRNNYKLNISVVVCLFGGFYLGFLRAINSPYQEHSFYRYKPTSVLNLKDILTNILLVVYW